MEVIRQRGPVLLVDTKGPLGRAAFAGEDINEGTVLWEETPLVCLQLPSRTHSCTHCLRFIGTLVSQLRLLTGLESPRLPSCIDAEESFLADIVPCRHGCGAEFCSTKCESQAEAHRILCQVPKDSYREFEQHAVAENRLFLLGAKALAHVIARWRENGLDFALAVAPFLEFQWRYCRWDAIVLPKDVPKGEEADFREAMKEVVSKSHRLLVAALSAGGGEMPAEISANFELYSRILGAFVTNNFGIDIDSPLIELFALFQQIPSARKEMAPVMAALKRARNQKSNLGRYSAPPSASHSPIRTADAHTDEEMGTGREEGESLVDSRAAEGNNSMAELMSESASLIGADPANESTGAGSDDQSETSEGWEDLSEEGGSGAESDTDEEEQAEGKIFPSSRGTGLFSDTAFLNHSCTPNVTVEFLDSSNAVVLAMRPIKRGDELRCTYVDNTAPLAKRQHGLREYGFVCECRKCVQEGKMRRRK